MPGGGSCKIIHQVGALLPPRAPKPPLARFMNDRTRWLLLPLLLSLGVWSSSFSNGFVWDDHVLIEKNVANLSSFSFSSIFGQDFWTTETDAGSSNYYRPLVTLSYVIDYALFGVSSSGFHVTNVILHSLNVALLFFLLTELALPLAVCAAGAALFAVHPALAESVAWVSGRTDLVATTWILLCILVLLAACKTQKPNVPGLLVAGLCCLGGLLSKESALLAPLLALGFAGFVRGSRAVTTLTISPFLAAGAIWLTARSQVLSSPVGASLSNGVSNEIGLLSLLHVWGALLWPPFFRIEYGSPLTVPTLAPGAVCGALAVAGLLLWTLRPRTPKAARALSAAALVAFIPSVMAVMLKSMIGVRLVYTSAAFALPAVAVVLSRRLPARAATAVLACAISALAALSFLRIPLWTSDQVLFLAALEAPDASSRSHLNLGIALYNTGDLRGAYEHLSMPIDPAAADQQHYMLGLLYTGAQCETKAEAEYRLAAAAKPSSYSAAHNLAGLLFVQGKKDAAKQVLNQFAAKNYTQASAARRQLALFGTLTAAPERAPLDRSWCASPEALRELFGAAIPLNRQASELLRARQTEMAEVFIKAAMRADPNLVAAQLNFAQLLMLRGEMDEASELLRKLIRENPGDDRPVQLLLRSSQAAAPQPQPNP